MLEIVNELIDKVFTYENKKYKVLSVDVKNQKAIILTDRRTFVFLSSELNDFMDKIIVLNPSVESFIQGGIIPGKDWKPSKEMVIEATPLQKEIIAVNERSRRITDKLEDVFNELSEKPSEDTFKKAAAMVSASNSIVNIQMANYKFLSLK